MTATLDSFSLSVETIGELNMTFDIGVLEGEIDGQIDLNLSVNKASGESSTTFDSSLETVLYFEASVAGVSLSDDKPTISMNVSDLINNQVDSLTVDNMDQLFNFNRLTAAQLVTILSKVANSLER